MSFIDGEDGPWWDNEDIDISDDARRILEEHIEEESDTEEIVEASEVAEEETGDNPLDEWEDAEDTDLIDFADDPHNAPENEVDESWELVHHFDFGGDAYNYVEGVPVGPLWIIVNEDGSADVYVDRDYDGASV